MPFEHSRRSRLQPLPLSGGEMLGKGHDVFGTIREKRQVDHDSRKSLKQIVPELTAIEPLGRILLGSGHDPEIDSGLAPRAEWLNFSSFQGPEKFHLRR